MIIETLFLTGVALQVFIALLNKAVNWAVYYGHEKSEFKTSWQFRTATCLSGKFLIDLFIDIETIGLFGWATFQVPGVLAAQTGQT